MPKIALLVVQPTPFCNIDCDYCYLPNRSVKASMSLEVLESVLRNVFRSEVLGPDLTLVWHAGEPLVVPIDYYRAAIRLTERLCPPSCKLQHSIQTNGTLINDEWCHFFLEHDIRVGVSLDGPREIHDRHRKTRNGTGSFDKTIAGVQFLKRHNKEFHVISVLTEANIFLADEMFYFYEDLGIDNICFNIEESDGVHASTLLGRADRKRAYAEFLEAFLFLVRANNKTWFVREYDQMRNSIFRPKEAEFTNPQVEPFSIISVDVNGRFTTFSPEFIGMNDKRLGDFTIGDLTRGPIEQALSNPKFHSLLEEISRGVEACKADCEYFSVCGGGAPANKLGEHGTMASTVTGYCECVTMGPADIILSLLDSQITAGAGHVGIADVFDVASKRRPAS